MKSAQFTASLDGQNRLDKLYANGVQVLQVVYVGGVTSTYQFSPAAAKLDNASQALMRNIIQTYILANVNVQTQSGRAVSRLQGRVSNSAFDHTERWAFYNDAPTGKDIFFDLFTGRGYPDSAVYESQAGFPYSKWTVPPALINAQNVSEGANFRNAIDLTNCVGGVTAAPQILDQIYIEPKMAFAPPALMRISAWFPDVSTLPAGTECLFGFEVNSQGGNAIYAAFMEQNKFWLRSKCMTPTGLDQQNLDITATIPAQAKANWNTEMLLYYDPPWLTLFEADNINALSVMGTVTTGTNPDAGDYVNAFIGNESSVILPAFAAGVPNWAVGHWSIWQRANNPLALTPQIFNVTMTAANTEYSQALPTHTKKYLIHTADESAFRLAFVTGKVAAPTRPYFSILANEAYWEDLIKFPGTLYFGTANAGAIAEIIVWT